MWSGSFWAFLWQKWSVLAWRYFIVGKVNKTKQNTERVHRVCAWTWAPNTLMIVQNYIIRIRIIIIKRRFSAVKKKKQQKKQDETRQLMNSFRNNHLSSLQHWFSLLVSQHGVRGEERGPRSVFLLLRRQHVQREVFLQPGHSAHTE